jgi:hypothetical protein
VLIRDHSVIVYDNTVRSTKIARRLNLMQRLSQLLMRNIKPITDILVALSWRFQMTRAMTEIIALARD